MEIKVYFTNLAKYNEGNLVGEWVTLGISNEELKIIVDRVLKNDEEYFITDFDSPFPISEYENVYELNEFVLEFNNKNDDEQKIISYLIDNCNLSYDEALSRYEDVTYYQAESYEDLAYEFVEEGLFGEIPESIQYYLDYEKIGRGLSSDYDEYEGLYICKDF